MDICAKNSPGGFEVLSACPVIFGSFTGGFPDPIIYGVPGMASRKLNIRNDSGFRFMDKQLFKYETR
jgi:hypothetical protein